MALDPHRSVTHSSPEPPNAPKMLRRPADAPPPLEPLREQEVIGNLHMDWARANAAMPSSSAWQRARSKARRALSLGRSNRQLAGSLIRAVDAVAVRCDELADRLASQEALTQDVAESFGEDITSIRAGLQSLPTDTQEVRPPLGG